MDFGHLFPEWRITLYQKAQSIVNAAQSTPERGWKAFESLKNRYWLVENLTNSTYAGVREAMYNTTVRDWI